MSILCLTTHESAMFSYSPNRSARRCKYERTGECTHHWQLQVAVNAYEALGDAERAERMLAAFDGGVPAVQRCYYRAVDCMARLNRQGATLARTRPYIAMQHVVSCASITHTQQRM